MTDSKKNAVTVDDTKLEELDADVLDKAAGGYGRRMYYSYDTDKSASFTTEPSDRGTN